MQLVPEPTHQSVPAEWRTISEQMAKSGTLVVWSKLDVHRLTWKGAKATLENVERLAGRIYRRFISNGSIRIRLFAKEESGTVVYDREAEHDDPLYLSATPLVPKPFDDEPMFDHAFDDQQTIEYEGKSHTVKLRYSVAKKKTVDLAGTKKQGRYALRPAYEEKHWRIRDEGRP